MSSQNGVSSSPDPVDKQSWMTAIVDGTAFRATTVGGQYNEDGTIRTSWGTGNLAPAVNDQFTIFVELDTVQFDGSGYDLADPSSPVRIFYAPNAEDGVVTLAKSGSASLTHDQATITVAGTFNFVVTSSDQDVVVTSGSLHVEPAAK
ncbi:hypothetical protein GFY24_39365 [Nocardia sp. SYP-A9097]|uniref:hypothetical protein n=1 Tax=Nocardia sp. SYP-A9097 TaxID=2663237 RepID=UPI00129ADAEC|nr:hypothetical protein [Nocardia sp. SYP-A9097]MRH93406.1 hypothetical protein [Nocardia sp. SYP-A9097]